MYWLITDDGTINGTPIAIIPGDLDQPANSIEVNEDDPIIDVFKIGGAKGRKTDDIKTEGLLRMQGVLSGIKDFDQVELLAEQWQSIAPAARQPTTIMQSIIDIYQAGKSAVITVNALTTLAAVEAYDPVIDPAWPV